MSKKILVIDNNQDILDLISIILQQKGYQVVASTQADIVDDVLKIQPDLILLDEWLDGIKGHELCKTLKVEHTTNHIPVIIISAINGLEQVASDCMADNYIQKPFDIDYLAEVVASAL